MKTKISNVPSYFDCLNWTSSLNIGPTCWLLLLDKNLHWKKYTDFKTQKSLLQSLSIFNYSNLVLSNCLTILFYDNGINYYFFMNEKKSFFYVKIKMSKIPSPKGASREFPWRILMSKFSYAFFSYLTIYLPIILCSFRDEILALRMEVSSLRECNEKDNKSLYELICNKWVISDMKTTITS